MTHLIAAVLTMSVPPVVPAPVSATGLTAGRTFEAWVRFPGSDNRRKLGMDMHAGDRIRVTFPRGFTPVGGDPMAYLLYGWPQGDARAAFDVRRDARDPRTIEIDVRSTIAAVSPQMPGVKVVHLVAPLRNPAPGTYHVHITVTRRGRIEAGDERVTIGPSSSAQLAPYNAMHAGRNEDYQTVRIGQRMTTDIDFLYTDANGNHPDVTLQTVGDAPVRASVMNSGTEIGRIVASGGLTLVPQAAPRTGIVRVGLIAPRMPGMATLTARTANGVVTTLHVNVVR